MSPVNSRIIFEGLSSKSERSSKRQKWCL